MGTKADKDARLSRLLAAEAQYLGEAGWVPNVPIKGSFKGMLLWSKGDLWLCTSMALKVQRSEDERQES
jgi:hypothetical protein